MAPNRWSNRLNWSPRSKTAVILAIFFVLFGCGEDGVSGENNDLNVGESDTYTLGGTLDVDDADLLADDGVTLQNGGDELTLAEVGEFTFSDRLEDGESYDVTIHNSLAEHECDVENGSGTVDGADVDDVYVQCTLIDETPFFEITINEGTSALNIEEGQTARIDVVVENQDAIADEQDISVDIGGVYEETKEDIHIEAGATEELSFEWSTNLGDAGSYGATVTSHEDTADTTVVVDEADVEPGVDLSISIDQMASTLQAPPGDPIVVNAALINNTDSSIEQQLTLDIEGIQEDAQDVQVDANSADSVEFQWQTTTDDDGFFEATVTGDDDSDTTTVFVGESDSDFWLTGLVNDIDTGEKLTGVEVMLFEPGEETAIASGVTDDDGIYEIDDLDEGNYELRLQAPGLEPGYEIDGASGGDMMEVTIAGGSGGLNAENISVDWLSETDFIVDGGLLDFEYDTAGGVLEFELPGCQEQADGSWEAEEVDAGDDIEVEFDPAGDCFRIDEVGIDIATGVLDVDTDDISFPNVIVTVDDEDDDIDEMVDEIVVEFEWLLDGIAGDVDFTDGSMHLDIDLRILLGGTVQAGFLPIDFGSRAGDDDCQFASAWGGDVTDPTTDDDDEQIGEYLHDSIELRLTTEESGPNDVSGVPYDEDQHLFLTVDNSFEIGRLSEGQHGADDDGGASCGEFAFGTDSQDYAAALNDLANLPADSGSLLGEFDFLLPVD